MPPMGRLLPVAFQETGHCPTNQVATSTFLPFYHSLFCFDFGLIDVHLRFLSQAQDRHRRLHE